MRRQPAHASRRVCRLPARVPLHRQGDGGCWRVRARPRAGVRPRGRRPGRAVRVRRLRRLPQHPAAGPERARHVGAGGGVQGRGHVPAALERPARDVLEPDDRGPDHRGADPAVLQGRDLRGARRGCREQREPGAGRDDRARLGVRRAAHLRRHAGRVDVRDRLRDRRGPAVLHRRAQALGPGRPRPVRRRLERRDGRGRVVERALHPAGPRQPDQLGRVELARRTAGPERRDQLRRRDQRVHRQGREPAGRADDDARGVRRDRTAPGPRAVHGRGSRLDRDAGRRDLRQRWRPAALERGPVREHAAEVRARALHGGGVARAERAAGEQEEKEAQAQEAQGQVEAEEVG